MTSPQYCPRKLELAYVTQTALAETPHILDMLVELTLGQNELRIWMFVANIRNEFFLGWTSASPQYDNKFEARNTTTVTKMMCQYVVPDPDPDNVIRARCERAMRSRLEGPLQATA
jgi:hypothetical protein